MTDLNEITKANPGRKIFIELNHKKYARYPIKTQLVKPGDNIVDFVIKNIKDIVESRDIVFVSEKATAISQGRAYYKKTIKVSKLARFLVRFTTKSDRGVGISSPETFQLAIDECGTWRIFLAAFLAGITKLFGIQGIFYRIAGEKAALIDGAADYVIPPYNKYVSKGPLNCEKICRKIAQKIDRNVIVLIVDINDYGGRVVQEGSQKIDKKFICEVLKDNPLGQTNEMTPIGIIRKV